MHRFNREAFFNSMNRFMTQIEVFKVEARTEKRSIAIRCEVDGLA